ncbi:hypothetical protein [Brevundimonas sp.]|uniref:hypothetical protein n=1 Tax=Brevundimonas sp. TaxID=1871086 RepID=UPI002D466005|nr:hypothetical protein [Brevundimonas sp.]HYD29222.1 hypothetical protein [Brevundimonas sp.]
MLTDSGPVHVQMFSGGEGSWGSAKRVVGAHGVDRLYLYFSDTLVEDEDLYRFLIEGAANVFGVPAPQRLLDRLAGIPPMEDEAARGRFLQDLAAAAAEVLPRLVWVAEGRTPWQVFFDERFLGNSRHDPCSKILKRQLADRWLRENCDPAQTVVYVGIDWTEEHRYTELRDRRAAVGWRYEAPLCGAPYVLKDDIRRALEAEGIASARLYALGFSHNNCGGFCIKAGHGHFANLLRTMPARYAYHERREQEIREYLGRTDIAMLVDRRGGGKRRPMTLRELRERIEAGAQVDRHDIGGCGCFAVEEAEP